MGLGDDDAIQALTIMQFKYVMQRYSVKRNRACTSSFASHNNEIYQDSRDCIDSYIFVFFS